MNQEPDSSTETTQPPAPTITRPSTSDAPPDTRSVTSSNQNPLHHSSPNVIILQWLTYALWGWTVLALSFLVSSVLAHFFVKDFNATVTPYGTAAVLVLAPIAFICDSFYNKYEPRQKKGGTAIVMIVHAVLFALFCVGALIAAVFTLVQLFTSTNSKPLQAALMSSAAIALLYGLTFIRTLNPLKFHWIQKWYKFVMLGIIVVVAILGFVGPVMSQRAARNDKLIETNLQTVNNSINRYVATNHKLPANLEAVSLTGDSKLLVTKKLVVYKPEGKLDPLPTQKNLGIYSSPATTAQYKYQLCTTYTKASAYQSYYDDQYSTTEAESDGYSSSLTAYSHPAGEVCYKLKTTSYSYTQTTDPTDVEGNVTSEN